MKELFAGQIGSAIGLQIKYLKVLICEKGLLAEPLIFWLQTEDLKWHRFFLDAWVPHWMEYNVENTRVLIEDDLEEGRFEGEIHKVKDLMEIFDLENQKILNVEMSYLNIDNLLCGQLMLEIEGNQKIIINDFGNEKNAELIINGKQI